MKSYQQTGIWIYIHLVQYLGQLCVIHGKFYARSNLL